MSPSAAGVLRGAAFLHLVLGVCCVGWWMLDLPPILGVHPALKPLKFAISIAVFLGTMSLLVPRLDVDPRVRLWIAWTLVVTMALEVTPIVAQAMRGTTSHYNLHGALSAAIWQMMVLAIVVATIAMLGTAILASARPLMGADGQPLDLASTIAWRAGLWLFPLAAFSGFTMGGRLQHSVGGLDGGAGVPFANWSLTHGDLRLAHFVSLHGLQTLPAISAALALLPLTPTTRVVLVVAAVAVHWGLALATLVQGLAGRPLL